EPAQRHRNADPDERDGDHNHRRQESGVIGVKGVDSNCVGGRYPIIENCESPAEYGRGNNAVDVVLDGKSGQADECIGPSIDFAFEPPEIPKNGFAQETGSARGLSRGKTTSEPAPEQ